MDENVPVVNDARKSVETPDPGEGADVESSITQVAPSTQSTVSGPPPDRSFHAWGVLISAFAVEAIQWGLPLTYGIFQNYYFTRPGPFQGDLRLTTVGVLGTGVVQLGLPLTSPLLDDYPRSGRIWIGAGAILEILALVGASFASNTPILILTQGLLYSVGELLLYMPLLALINEWFIERRGLAYGIVDSSTGASGTALPFLLQALLHRYGAPATLRGFAVAIAVLQPFALFFLRARSTHRVSPSRSSSRSNVSVSSPTSSTTPSSSRSHRTATTTTTTAYPILRILWRRHLYLFKQPLFHIHSINIVIQGLGFYMPSLFLPVYATSSSLSQTDGALLVALIFLSQVFGQITFGRLSDGKGIPVPTLQFISNASASLATFLLWGLADNSLAMLSVYAVVYGFFANGYKTLWARAAMALSPDDDPAVALVAYGMFCAQRGLGNVLAGPLSELLVEESPGGSGISQRSTAGAHKHVVFGMDEYAGVIGFTGACLVVSAAVSLVPGVLPERWKGTKGVDEGREGCED